MFNAVSNRFDHFPVIFRHSSVDNRVNNDDSHTIENLGALNTDGFDVQGRDIYIHDCRWVGG